SGPFDRQFALAISFSTLLSAFNSLTLSPALAALLLQPKDARPDWFTRALNAVLGWPFRLFNRGISAMNSRHIVALRRVVRFSLVVLLIYVGLLWVTYRGFRHVPT